MGRLAVRAPPTRNRGRNRALRGHLRLPVSGSFDRRGIRRPPAHPLPPPADRTRRSRPHMHDHPVNAPHIPHEPVTWVSRGGRGGAGGDGGRRKTGWGGKGVARAWTARREGRGRAGRGRGNGVTGQQGEAGEGVEEVREGRLRGGAGVGRRRRGRVGRRSPAEGAHAHGVAESGGLGAARLDPVAQLPRLCQLPQELRPPPSTRGIVLPPAALHPISRTRHLIGCLCCSAGGSRRVFGCPCCSAGGSRCVFGCPCWSARRSRRVFGSPQRPAGRPRSPTGRLRCPIAGARRPAALLRRTVCRPGCPAARTCRPVGRPRRPAARACRLVGRVSTLGRRSLVGGRFPVGRPVGAA